MAEAKWRRPVKIALGLVFIAGIIGLIALSRIQVVESVWPSRSGGKVAVVETSLLARLLPLCQDFPEYDRLYIYPSGKAGSRQFVGNVLDDISDRFLGIRWSPDESKIAVINGYDQPKPVVIIVDLNDQNDRVRDPRWSSTDRLTKNDMRTIIHTKYGIRTPELADVKWLGAIPPGEGGRAGSDRK